MSSVIGNSRIRLPVAWNTALATAAADAGDADLADSPCTDRRVFVRNVGPQDLDRWHVQVDRDVILGQRGIHDAAVAPSKSVSSVSAIPIPMMIPPRN